MTPCHCSDCYLHLQHLLPGTVSLVDMGTMTALRLLCIRTEVLLQPKESSDAASPLVLVHTMVQTKGMRASLTFQVVSPTAEY